jgi:hypothetical protein
MIDDPHNAGVTRELINGGLLKSVTFVSSSTSSLKYCVVDGTA